MKKIRFTFHVEALDEDIEVIAEFDGEPTEQQIQRVFNQWEEDQYWAEWEEIE